jgi:prepilin-type processing-associated H-X9-DG protein
MSNLMSKKKIYIFAGLLCIFLFTAWLVEKWYASNNKMNCFSRMHKIGLSFSMYCEDYDNKLPLEKLWLTNKINNRPLEGCPSVRNNIAYHYIDGENVSYKTTINHIPGYAYNSDLQNHRRNEFAYPNKTILVCEEALEHPIALGGVNPYIEFSSGPAWQEKGWERHHGGAHYLFADGHVEWLKESDIEPLSDQGVTGLRPTFGIGSRQQVIDQTQQYFQAHPNERTSP